jgi:iron complex transport system substrate-binding protein
MLRTSTCPSPLPPERPKRLWHLALVLVLLCSTQARAEISVTDDQGQTIVLARPATRVIALYGALNEILDGLGQTSRIVARANADETPSSITKLPSIGTHRRPNIEAVLAQKPDLVLQMAGRKETSQSVEALKKHGVRVAVFRASSFAELFSIIRRVGALTGADAQAEDMVRGMEARLAALAARIANTAERPRVFFEVHSPNMYGAGQSSVVAEIINHAGGVNCVEERVQFAHLSEEELMWLKPEVYLIQRGPMNRSPLPLSARPRLRTLPAAQNSRAWFVDELKYSRPGPRNIDAAEELAGLLHPELAGQGVKPPKGPKRKGKN